ncbi:hypothetical protein SAMN06265360_10259 [Haloechinothrix alba]|uniref:Uncharacterized protein n=1 Tax=Haloechinothrix alba TaxID=664784 RepID=A0A238VCY3_9PSEU|nr:hypothetical protein [Haloechinothrix alba]SNR32024.1 hypothetical protein SAMN06265360_10259 [Haloechinothrix alba]
MRGEAVIERVVLGVLVLDAALLAVLELFFLPLRLDGRLLPAFGDVPFPLVVVLAVVTTPLLVQHAGQCARRLGRTPWSAGLPLLAWSCTLLVLAVAGPGGDQVFVADWRTIVLLAGGGLTGAYSFGRAMAVTARATVPAAAGAMTSTSVLGK